MSSPDDALPHCEITYALDWNDKRDRPLESHDEAWARERYNGRGKFTVILWLNNEPNRWLTVDRGAGIASVTFVDGRHRPVLNYHFNMRPDGRWFMSRMISWTYPDDQVRGLRNASHLSEVFLRPDGYSQHLDRTLLPKGQESGQMTEYRGVPVDAMWEPDFAFGDWLSVARYDRETSLTARCE